MARNYPSDDGKGRVHQVKPEAGERPVYTPATPNGNRKSKEEIRKERELQKAISNPLVKNSLAKASFLEMDAEKQTEENKKNCVRDNLSDFCSSANFESKFVRVSYRDENNPSVNRDFYIVPNKFLENSEKEILDKDDKACQGCKICLPDGQQISFAEACTLAYNGIEKADEKILGKEAEKEKEKQRKEKEKDDKRRKEERKKKAKKVPLKMGMKTLTTAERAVVSVAKSVKNVAVKTAEKAVERTAEVGDFGR